MCILNFRVKIVPPFNQKGDKVMVELLDQGGFIQVEPKQLLALHKDYLYLSTQAWKARLQGKTSILIGFLQCMINVLLLNGSHVVVIIIEIQWADLFFFCSAFLAVHYEMES